MPAYDTDQVVRDLGRRIAELREDRRLTQSDLAKRLRYSVQHVSQLENGTNITVSTLARIANALGVRLPDLFVEPTSRARRRPGRPRVVLAAAAVAKTTTHDYERVRRDRTTGNEMPPGKRRPRGT